MPKNIDPSEEQEPIGAKKIVSPANVRVISADGSASLLPTGGQKRCPGDCSRLTVIINKPPAVGGILTIEI